MWNFENKIDFDLTNKERIFGKWMDKTKDEFEEL